MRADEAQAVQQSCSNAVYSFVSRQEFKRVRSSTASGYLIKKCGETMRRTPGLSVRAGGNMTSRLKIALPAKFGDVIAEERENRLRIYSNVSHSVASGKFHKP